MYFKRNESYRFVFNEPVKGKLTKKENNNTVTTEVQLMDVSNQGAKIICRTPVNLKKDTDITLSFNLNSSSFHATGNIKWIKNFQNTSEMGLHLNTDDEYRNMMIMELKDIAKQNNKKQK
ncbi:PilZ domain-containing protein [Virgibacillus doumboii]|uniref:PilZ domain-containing protein n=1 Tax=Virgibacillus doumboii TaxID=2697503 RepID=UPI0013DF18BD|nr:PilZ domain-containing protein [Virgibacillus doumboii]